MSHPDQPSQSLLLQPAPPEEQRRHLPACVTVLDAQGRACFLYKAGVLLPAALGPAHVCTHALQGWCRLCSRVFRGMLSCTLLLKVCSCSALSTAYTPDAERERKRVSGHC